METKHKTIWEHKFGLINAHSWPWAKSTSYFSNDPRFASWSTCLIMLVLTTSFKCSFIAFLTSTSLSRPPIMMAQTNAHRWARMMFLGHPRLEGSTWGTHSLQILEHVEWVIANNFDTSCVLRPCCNMAIAFNLFTSSNALMDIENLHNYKRKMS